MRQSTKVLQASLDADYNYIEYLTENKFHT